jgi:hypothetical protein
MLDGSVLLIFYKGTSKLGNVYEGLNCLYSALFDLLLI